MPKIRFNKSFRDVLAFDMLLHASHSACRRLMPQLRNPYPAFTFDFTPAVVSLTFSLLTFLIS